MENELVIGKIDKFLENEDPIIKIHNLSRILTYYSVKELETYYKERKNILFISFKDRKSYLSEFIANFPAICKFISDDFYSEVLYDYFIKLNSICSDYLNEGKNITTINAEFFLIEDYISLDAKIMILDSGRVIRLVSQGVLEPWFFNSITFPLSANTFRFYLTQITLNTDKFIPEDLIRYNLKYDEWLELLSVLKSSRVLYNKLFKALKHSERKNITSYILSEIYGLSTKEVEFKCSYKDLTKLTCRRHNKSVRPYDTFTSIGDLTKDDIYLIYLKSKVGNNNLLENSDNILEIAQENFEGIKEDLVSKSIYRIFEFDNEFPNLSLTLNSSIPNEFDRFLHSHYKYANPKELIMDLIFYSDFFEFNFSLFSYFIDFPLKFYYEKNFMIFGNKIIQNSIQPKKPNKVYSDFLEIYRFLYPFKELPNTYTSSIDFSNIEFTDLNEDARIEEETESRLPLIYLHSYICFSFEDKHKIIQKYKEIYSDEELYRYKIIKIGNTQLTQKCFDFNQLIHMNISNPKKLIDILVKNSLNKEFDFEDIGEALKSICEKHLYSSTLIQKVQRYIITALDTLNIKEEDFFLLEEMFEILIKVKSVSCRVLNEIIFKKIIRLAKLMDKDIVIGNIK